MRVVELEGDPALFERFAGTLRVPYSPNVPAGVRRPIHGRLIPWRATRAATSPSRPRPGTR
jgi:hypothetical protein